MSRTALAQWVSECPDCSVSIQPGDLIAYDELDNSWGHFQCPRVAEPNVCKTCFIYPCDCED